MSHVSRIPSPARSHGGLITPRRARSSRRVHSVGSASTTPARLSSVIEQFKENNMESFALSPMDSRVSILTDNTEIEQPKRKSWWKKLDDNSRDMQEVLDSNNPIEDVDRDIMEYIGVDILSQEKKDYTVDLPESSGSESIASIVIPQRRLFSREQQQPPTRFIDIVKRRETLNKTNCEEDNIDIAPRNLFRKGTKLRAKPTIPAALLTLSPNKTIDKTKELNVPQVQVRKLFGNRAGEKRKNAFADFILSESEDEISEIQPKVFAFNKKTEACRPTNAVSRLTRNNSLASNVTTDLEMDDWNMLPSSTLVDNQLEHMIGDKNTPFKKAKLIEDVQANDSDTSSNKSVPLNKSASKNISIANISKNKFHTSQETEQFKDKSDKQYSVHEKTLEKSHNSSQHSSNLKTDDIETSSESSQKNNSIRKSNEISQTCNVSAECSDASLQKVNCIEVEKESGMDNSDEEFISLQYELDDLESNTNENVEINSSLEKTNTRPDNISENVLSIMHNSLENVQLVQDAQNEISNKHSEVEGESNKVGLNEKTQGTEKIKSRMGRDDTNNDAVTENKDRGLNNENITEVRTEATTPNAEDRIVDTLVQEEEDRNANDESKRNISQVESDQEIDSEDSAQTNSDLGKDNEYQETEMSNNQEIDCEDSVPNSPMETEEVPDQDTEYENSVEISSPVAADENEDQESEESNEEVEESEDDEQDMEINQTNDTIKGSEANETNEDIETDENNDTENYDNEVEQQSDSDHILDQNHEKLGEDNEPEKVLHDVTNKNETFFNQAKATTSIRKTKSIQEPNIYLKHSLAPVRESTGTYSNGTRNSSAEGSGWDSHRTTRKTMRQTFGTNFSPRKSLRTLVLEKSAKRQTVANEANAQWNIPLANSTQLRGNNSIQLNGAPADEDDIQEESSHEISIRTRQRTLETYLKTIKRANMEKRAEIQEAVKASLNAPSKYLKDPYRTVLPKMTRTAQTKPKAKPSKPIYFKNFIPKEILDDMQYKPQKRFAPSNASWITKRLYKYLETKLEPKYDYKARVRAEKLVEKLYIFTKEAKRHEVAPPDAVHELKMEMARLDIVRTHFEFYGFFRDFMPIEIRTKVNPDIMNNIPTPRNGVFSEILPSTSYS